MIRLLTLCLLLFPMLAQAQSLTVLPHELDLQVTVEEQDAVPLEREMVMITIKGIYRRHITRETLVQPDFEGFSWAQLGPDNWREERLDGKLVKIFERRMAIYPDRAGTLTIGAFRHKLTLTDEGDDWFDHQIQSQPVTIEVAAAPTSQGWWFPVRGLRISDRWSNAPDQLQPGEGVLRIVQLEALGATPEMIPPMPELTSPSAMIFPHPEKRLVELTPEGPVTYAFWRWTIRPSNDISTIVEPLRFEYFDTRERVAREVTISAQRVAYGDVAPEIPQSDEARQAAPPEPATLPGPWAVLVFALIFTGGCALGLSGLRFSRLRRFALLDPLRRQLKRAARVGDAPATRRAAEAITRRDGPHPKRADLLRTLDQTLFDPRQTSPDLRGFAQAFLRHQPKSVHAD